MKQRKVQYLSLLVAIAILAGALLYTRQLIARQAAAPRPQAVSHMQRPEVAITEAIADTYSAHIEGYGEATPHYSLTLTSQTAGKILSQSPQLEPGSLVQKGEMLIQLESSDYQSAVAAAKATLATARLDLLEAEREARQAVIEWKASGLKGEPDSELVLHKPQLTAAEAEVDKAEAALVSAEQDLADTKIMAPFNAIVVDRKTSPGGFLQAGSEVAILYSTDMVEVSIPLCTRDWKNLPDIGQLAEKQWPVQLTGVENGNQWTGRVLRAEHHIDGSSRQRSLIVAVDSPMDLSQPLLPGTFVKASLNGIGIARLWRLPNSALSQSGEIWYLNDENSLERFSAEPLFSTTSAIYIKPPEDIGNAQSRVVTQPLSSYLPGMRITPVTTNLERKDG